MTKAQEEFKKKGEEIKAKIESEKRDAAKDSLAVISGNEDLMKMYQDNANVGAENLGGQSPALKIHATGRSTKNYLNDGTEPNDGYFFYAPTSEQFKEIECHILTISRGYRADGMDDRKNVFNQLMAGVIVNDGKPRPFIMYINGLRLSRMWEFGKEAGKYTHAKPISIPMFALRVKLTTNKVEAEYQPGKKTRVWVTEFEIMKNDDGSPVVVSNLKVFDYLKAQVAQAKETIQSIIEAKATEDVTTDPRDLPETVDEQKVLNAEAINPDDIPF